MTTLSLPLDDGLLESLRELARHEDVLTYLLDLDAEVQEPGERKRLALDERIAAKRSAIRKAEHAIALRVLIEARMASLVAPLKLN